MMRKEKKEETYMYFHEHSSSFFEFTLSGLGLIESL